MASDKTAATKGGVPPISMLAQTRAMRQSLLFTSEHDFTLQTNVFISNDDIGCATHFQMKIILVTNMFIASDERVFAGDVHF